MENNFNKNNEQLRKYSPLIGKKEEKRKKITSPRDNYKKKPILQKQIPTPI